jgi:hypothetical protein
MLYPLSYGGSAISNLICRPPLRGAKCSAIVRGLGVHRPKASARATAPEENRFLEKGGLLIVDKLPVDLDYPREIFDGELHTVARPPGLQIAGVEESGNSGKAVHLAGDAHRIQPYGDRFAARILLPECAE